MEFLFKKTNETLDDFEIIEELIKETYLAGKREASKWLENANLEQIKRILSTYSFLEYAKNNDVNFIYAGAITELAFLFDAYGDGCDTILKEHFDNHQVEFAEFLKKKLDIKYVTELNELNAEMLKNYNKVVTYKDNDLLKVREKMIHILTA